MPFSIGLLIPNVGIALDYSSAASSQTRHIYEGLVAADHKVSLLQLKPGKQILYSNAALERKTATLGFSSSFLFTLPESILRRIQSEFNLPYLGIFDSLRFCDACLKNLDGVQIIHERHSLFGVGGALANKRLKLPFVLFFDADPIFELDYIGRPLKGLQRRAAIWGCRLTLQAASAVVCVSEIAKNHLVQHWDLPGEKIHVFPNATDVELFYKPHNRQKIRQQLGLDKHKIVMFTGRFNHWHGIGLLVDAFSKVAPVAPQAHLVLVGDGTIRSEIEAQVKAASLTDRVTFTGQVNYLQAPDYMAAADILVAPYPKEPPGGFWGSPTKIFDYMASGQAMVASAAGQIAEIIQDHHTGLLSIPGDASDLAEKILELLNAPSLAKTLGQNARSAAIQHYSWESYIQRLEALYASLL